MSPINGSRIKISTQINLVPVPARLLTVRTIAHTNMARKMRDRIEPKGIIMAAYSFYFVCGGTPVAPACKLIA